MPSELWKRMSPSERTALCDAAERAWGLAGPRTKKVTFSWKKRKYMSTLTSFRMLVYTIHGEPVVCRWG